MRGLSGPRGAKYSGFDGTIQGIDTVKVLAAEGQQAAHFQRHTTGLKKLSVRAGAVLSVFSPGIELLHPTGRLRVAGHGLLPDRQR